GGIEIVAKPLAALLCGHQKGVAIEGPPTRVNLGEKLVGFLSQFGAPLGLLQSPAARAAGHETGRFSRDGHGVDGGEIVPGSESLVETPSFVVKASDAQECAGTNGSGRRPSQDGGEPERLGDV